MKFITLGNVAINLERITFIDFRNEGRATVHCAGATFAFEGDDAAALLKRFPPRPSKPELVSDFEPNGNDSTRA